MQTIISTSEQQTKLLGQELAKKAHFKGFFCLYGELGSGKTVLSKGIALGMGIPEKQIKSPTYTLMRSYKVEPSAKVSSAALSENFDPHVCSIRCGSKFSCRLASNTFAEGSIASRVFYHFDFYRIHQIDDMMVEELEEIFQQKNVCIVVEWPERIEDLLPKDRVNIYMEYVDEDRRKVEIQKSKGKSPSEK